MEDEGSRSILQADASSSELINFVRAVINLKGLHVEDQLRTTKKGDDVAFVTHHPIAIPPSL